MTDETATPTTRSGRRAKDDVVDAEIVDEPTAPESELESESTVVEPAPTKTVAVDTTLADPASPQVVYTHAPAAPRKRGNRGIGTLIAVLSGLVFAALLAVATAIIGQVTVGRFDFGFLRLAAFYVPVLFFIIGFVLLVLILNRAAWWAYILGSLLLGVFVYFGTVAVGLLGQGIITHTPGEAAAMYGAALRDPFIIASAFIAREVSIWVGAAIAFRGRRVKLRNVEAHSAYERDLAEKRAEHQPGAATAV